MFVSYQKKNIVKPSFKISVIAFFIALAILSCNTKTTEQNQNAESEKSYETTDAEIPISAFDRFEDIDGVSSVIINKETFKMLAKFKGGGEEAKEYMEMVKDLNSFKVFTTNDENVSNEMKKEVDKYLLSSKLTELMRVKDSEANVKIYVKQGKDSDHVNELLMFVNNAINSSNESSKSRTVVLSLTGDIDINKISKLTESHIPNSGKHLKGE